MAMSDKSIVSVGPKLENPKPAFNIIGNIIPNSEELPSLACGASSLPQSYSLPSTQPFFPPGALEHSITRAQNIYLSSIKTLQTQVNRGGVQNSTAPSPIQNTLPNSEHYNTSMSPCESQPMCTDSGGLGRGAYRRKDKGYHDLRRHGRPAHPSPALPRPLHTRPRPAPLPQSFFCHQCQKEFSSIASCDSVACPFCGGNFIEELATVEQQPLPGSTNPQPKTPDGDYEFACQLSKDLESLEKRENLKASSGAIPKIRHPIAGEEESQEGFAFVPPGNLYQSFLKKEDKLKDWGNASNPYLYLEDEDVVDDDFPALEPPKDGIAQNDPKPSLVAASLRKRTNRHQRMTSNSCSTSTNSAEFSEEDLTYASEEVCDTTENEITEEQESKRFVTRVEKNR
jgi:hypothetical protein